MRDLLGLLNLANHRHVVLVGETGVGKRSLVKGLGLLMAEGKGPAGLTALVEMSETALLDDAEKAIDAAATRQARGGIYCWCRVPSAFFAGATTNAEFPKGARSLQRAFLGTDPVVIATTTDAAWNDRLAGNSAVSQNSHRLRVGEPNADETQAILRVHDRVTEKAKLNEHIDLSEYSIITFFEGEKSYADKPFLIISAEPLPSFLLSSSAHSRMIFIFCISVSHFNLT